MAARLLFILTLLFIAGCGGSANIAPQPFTRERADGKIPVKTELIRQQVRAELAGMPEGEAEVARWQQIETDYNACRLSEAEKLFANCMSGRGYVYMYPLDAEQLHNDIAFEMEKERNNRIAAEKQQQQETDRLHRQKELDKALFFIVLKGASDNITEFKRLIDDGANVKKKVKAGQTLLHFAAGHGHTKIALALVNAGVYIDEQDKDGAAAIHFAAGRGEADAIHTLAKAGANVNIQDYDGATPLHYAVVANEIEGVFALIKAGADINIKTKNDATPLDYALIKHGEDSIITLFLQKALKLQGGKDRQKVNELLRELE